MSSATVTKMQPIIPAAVFPLCFILGCWDKLAAASDDDYFGVDKLKLSSLLDDDNSKADSASNSDGSFKFKYEYEGNGNDTSHQYFILHGWRGHKNNKWINDTAAGILKLNGNKVVRLDWSPVAWWDYLQAVIAVKNYIGKELGKDLVEQYKNGKLDLNKLTLIGHDIGAHLVAIAAKVVFEKVGIKVGKIVAASPSGPGFYLETSRKKLQKDDAHCVVVIHTDRLMFGYKFPIGGYDFFANGGFHQPGCAKVYSGCSHKRAALYLAEAYDKIRYETAAPRSSAPTNEGLKKLIHMLGDDCPGGNGTYNFSTNREPPFITGV